MKQAVLVILIALLSVVSVFSQTGNAVLVKKRTAKVVESLGTAIANYHLEKREKSFWQKVSGIPGIDEVQITYSQIEKKNNSFYCTFYFQNQNVMSVGFYKKDGKILYLHSSELVLLRNYFCTEKDLYKILSAIRIPKPDWSNKKLE
ncbi:hypothetical protein HN954_00050 [bacterium]|jgi:hypothetical protein|nr:hypothetical protein [bacterium]MBT6832028.1 hypothetical protein [bacterium]MBT6995809.1 hypothetical protein [bacterium]MBT7772380.1 hypothetical protein [bacterium]